jgi:hypothetical protein
MKAFTMSDLRKKGDAPLSPKDRHSLNVGTGNYNRFAPLLPPPDGRRRINSKRKYENETPHSEPKTPRLDANTVFAQLKVAEDSVSEIRKNLNDAISIGESCYTSTDGGMGEAFFKLVKTVDLLIENQEKIISTVVDAMGMVSKGSAVPSYAAVAEGSRTRSTGRNNAQKAADVSPEELKVKKLKQAISKAEKSVTLFDLDLGSVPVLNRDTLSKKVTLALHERAQSEGIYKGNRPAAKEALDDILSCASIDILGKGSKTFYNKKDNNDPRNGKMCTVPIKLSFKDKNTRFQAELVLKKACKVKCATPYPRELRSVIDDFVKVCKQDRPGCFILAKVDVDKLLVSAKARTDKGWDDLGRTINIPLDLLDNAEQDPASQDDAVEMTNIS